MTLDAYIARRFQTRGVRFFHSENWRNFQNYCAAGAVLCRGELMRRDGEGFTAFYSDAEDRALGVLGRVFGNLNDLGSVYARSRRTIPNIYGPIMLVFQPGVFARMRDIRITRSSIASLHGGWASAALRTEQQLDELVPELGAGTLGGWDWFACEISCDNQTLPFDMLERVCVEPIMVQGQRLRDRVDAELRAQGIVVPVVERVYAEPSKPAALQSLVALCEGLQPPSDQEDWALDFGRLPETFRELSPQMQRRVGLWCRYFTYGTVLPLQAEAELDVEGDWTVCEMCDPGEERPPALIDWTPLLDGGSAEPLLDVGRCGWCSGISVRCAGCGCIRAVYESEYEERLACEGECGLMFIVRRDRAPDGDGSEWVEVVEPEAGLEETPAFWP
ncbi:hypothetical protein NR798_46160 [Archangium gephyra]|uniref:hypothetical protein n=1 Tax=Archangium gephyra TaxID=48 RepID=UPI0035D44350